MKNLRHSILWNAGPNPTQNIECYPTGIWLSNSLGRPHSHTADHHTATTTMMMMMMMMMMVESWHKYSKCICFIYNDFEFAIAPKPTAHSQSKKRMLVYLCWPCWFCKQWNLPTLTATQRYDHKGSRHWSDVGDLQPVQREWLSHGPLAQWSCACSPTLRALNCPSLVWKNWPDYSRTKTGS